MLMVMWMQKSLKINYFLKQLNRDWENLKAYPTRLVTSAGWFFFGFIPLFFVWYFVATNTGAFPYSLKEILLYFAFTWGLFYSINYMRGHFNSITNGDIVTKVIRPISLTTNYLYIFYSGILVPKISNLLIVIIIGLVFLGPSSLLGSLFFIIGLIIGCLVYVAVLFLMFWFGRNWGFKYVLDMLISISAGQLFPLDLLPGIIQTVIVFLPFKLMFYYPAKIFLGQMLISWTLILEYVVWVIVLYFVCRVLEYFGLRRYEQLGG